MMPRSFDPLAVELWSQQLTGAAEEMGAALERTAHSPNIKDRLDYSCALFNAGGLLIAQAAHIPVHLGAMPLMMAALRMTIRWSPGMMIVCNDPRHGGTHLPDLTVVAPVYADGRIAGFAASRAHHADIGGMSPGSLPLSTELYQEGLILPPVCLMRRGEIQPDVVSILCANSRTPAERRGDIMAQVAAVQTGVRRLSGILADFGREEFDRRCAENVRYAEALIRAAVKRLTPGIYQAEDVLDSDGQGQRDITIRVRVDVDTQGFISFDFGGSALQVRGSLNATEAITYSACAYAVRCVAGPDTPTNAGCFQAMRVSAPAGSVVNADFPAAVAAGNVETSQRIVDVIFQALAKAAPHLIPACSQGTMNNITIGGYDSLRGRPFAYYETVCGGAGAAEEYAGHDAIHTHMTNTRNTPVEILESTYPLRVQEYRIRENSGGDGEFPGGCGVVRTIELLCDCTFTLCCERVDHAPPGLNGAGDGAAGQCEICLPGGEFEAAPGKWSRILPAGTVLRVGTPGGGGWTERAS